MGWWLGLAPATLEFWVRFPNERNQGKQGATLCESTGFLTGPSPALGGLQIPCWLGSGPPMGWWLGLAPATLEFWVRFPNERNQRKQGATLC
jgi:hypothetical protein